MNKKYENMRKCISILYRQFQIYINNNTKDLGISASEYIFLMEMYKNDSMSQEQLSKNLIIDKAATARSIKSLEQKGYIVRNKDENDKRTNRIKLTKKGIEIKERLEQLFEKWNDIVADDVDNDSLNLVMDVINHMSIKAIEINKI